MKKCNRELSSSDLSKKEKKKGKIVIVDERSGKNRYSAKGNKSCYIFARSYREKNNHENSVKTLRLY